MAQQDQNQVLGRDKRGQFTSGSDAARAAGAAGGKAAQQSGNAHRLTDTERASGGRNSRRTAKRKSA